jgi:hypothetical protein
MTGRPKVVLGRFSFGFGDLFVREDEVWVAALVA